MHFRKLNVELGKLEYWTPQTTKLNRETDNVKSTIGVEKLETWMFNCRCKYILQNYNIECQKYKQNSKVEFWRTLNAVIFQINFFLFSTTEHYLQYNTYNTYLQCEVHTLLTILYSLYTYTPTFTYLCYIKGEGEVVLRKCLWKELPTQRRQKKLLDTCSLPIHWKNSVIYYAYWSGEKGVGNVW